MKKIFSIIMVLSIGLSSCKKEELDKTIRVQISSESQTQQGVLLKPTSLTVLLEDENGQYYRNFELRENSLNLTSLSNNAILLGSLNELSADEVRQVIINFSRSGTYIDNGQLRAFDFPRTRYQLEIHENLSEITDLEIRFLASEVVKSERFDSFEPSLTIKRR